MKQGKLNKRSTKLALHIADVTRRACFRMEIVFELTKENVLA